MEEKTMQPVPANVTTKYELFQGFGFYELKIVVIACLIGIVIFFALGILKKTVYIDVNNIPLEMTIGDSESLQPNSDGMIEKKVELIPGFWRAFAIIIPGAAAFFFVKRDPHTNRSLLSLLQDVIEFNKKQKLYLYKYNSGSEG